MTLTVTMRAESPFYDIFPNGIVPVRRIIPQACDLEGQGFEACYILDEKRCTSEQLQELAAAMAGLTGARLTDVAEEIASAINDGLPIRESQVAVPPSIDLRFLI